MLSVILVLSERASGLHEQIIFYIVMDSSDRTETIRFDSTKMSHFIPFVVRCIKHE